MFRTDMYEPTVPILFRMQRSGPQGWEIRLQQYGESNLLYQFWGASHSKVVGLCIVWYLGLTRTDYVTAGRLPVQSTTLLQEIVRRLHLEDLKRMHDVHVCDKTVVEVSGIACRTYFSRWGSPDQSIQTRQHNLRKEVVEGTPNCDSSRFVPFHTVSLC